MICLSRAALILALAATLSACSWFGDNEPEYMASAEHGPLKIPEGLDRPASPSPMIVGSPNIRKPAGDELEPDPPLVSASTGTEASDAYLAWTAEGVHLFVKDALDNVSVRLYKALGKHGMTLLEDSVTGDYKFHYEQAASADEGFFSSMAFWREKRLDFSGTFLTNLQSDGDNTRVYLLFGNGETVDTEGAEHVLAALLERLE
jgi:hypothetical protein